MNSAETECLVFERYGGSQALMDHFKNLGETAAEIFETCSGSGEVCGTPTPELFEQIKGSPVQVHWPFDVRRFARRRCELSSGDNWSD